VRIDRTGVMNRELDAQAHDSPTPDYPGAEEPHKLPARVARGSFYPAAPSGAAPLRAAFFPRSLIGPQGQPSSWNLPFGGRRGPELLCAPH
jgi:hypothetical protein